MPLFKKSLLMLVLGLFTQHSQGVLDIQITEGMEDALPIAIIPFGWSQAANLPSLQPADIIVNDLHRSGRFNPMDFSDLPQQPHDTD